MADNKLTDEEVERLNDIWRADHAGGRLAPFAAESDMQLSQAWPRIYSQLRAPVAQNVYEVASESLREKSAEFRAALNKTATSAPAEREQVARQGEPVFTDAQLDELNQFYLERTHHFPARFNRSVYAAWPLIYTQYRAPQVARQIPREPDASPQSPPAEPACAHEWIDARGFIIESGEWCPNCEAIRSGNSSGHAVSIPPAEPAAVAALMELVTLNDSNLPAACDLDRHQLAWANASAILAALPMPGVSPAQEKGK